MNDLHPARRGAIASLFAVLVLPACGGSPPSVSLDSDAGPISAPDGAVAADDAAVEADDAAAEAEDAAVVVDAWSAPGALGDSCSDARPCGPDLVCDEFLGTCAQRRSVDGLGAYHLHPDLMLALTAPLALADIVSVEVTALDATDAPVFGPATAPYVPISEVEGRASVYVRCVPGAMVYTSITLIDSAGVRSDPMVVTPTEVVHVDSGALCDGLGRICWSGECTDAADGMRRCP